MRARAVRTLEEEGYAVRAAEDGAAALETLLGDEGGPELIVTDVIMPRMNGRQLSDVLRTRRLP